VVKIAKETPKEDIAKSNAKKSWLEEHKLYVIGAIFCVAFVLGMFSMNYLNSILITRLNAGNTNTLATLQGDKAVLERDLSTLQTRYDADFAKWTGEKEQLDAQIIALERSSGSFLGMLDALDRIEKETREEPLQHYKITWKRYIVAEKGVPITTDITIENLITLRKTFSLEVNLKNVYNSALSKNPASGSLTLDRGSSGIINLKFEPVREGYGVYELLVNGHHAGDIIVFVR
jgi:hypothetical protein